MGNVGTTTYKRIVQYLWDPEPKNDVAANQSIWCLGTEYASRPLLIDLGNDRDSLSTQSVLTSRASPVRRADGRNHFAESDRKVGRPTTMCDDGTNGWPEPFLEDFESRIWITYRSHFTPIPRADNDGASSMSLNVRLRSQLMDSRGFTSDTGWGCMIRSGQSLLANTLLILRLGRDWRRDRKVRVESELLALFADHPDAQFSIHRFVRHGAEFCQTYPGEWFGPSATARCIEALSNHSEDPELSVYATNDSWDVYEDRFAAIAKDKSGRFRPTLILLGIRLGIDNVTSVYWDGLEATLKYPQSVGIAGGRPSASYYFVGVQGSYFFYLDPHQTRPALANHQNEIYSEEDLNSYHTRRLRRLHISDMDPSMLIGFLIKDENDWNDWKSRVASTPGKPIIHILQEEMQPDMAASRAEALDEVEALDDDFDEAF